MNEGSASRLSPSAPEESKSNTSWKPEQGTKEHQQVMAIANLWEINGGAKVTDADIHSMKGLLDVLDFKKLMDYLADTFICPKTKKVAWRNFAFWADSMDVDAEPSTKRFIDAWRRVKNVVSPSSNPAFTNTAGTDWVAHKKKVEHERAVEEARRNAKPGSHAERNPELHTGAPMVGADGTPLEGWRCRVCEMFYTKNEDRVCESCKAADFMKKKLRQEKIDEVRRNAKPGSHAERNPELHTGLDANGESWAKGAIKI
jgi:hypothetical protein